MLLMLLGTVLAGVMTTVVGMGGGMLLTAGLFTVMDPIDALALAGVALLAGNLHRIWLYWDAIDRSVAWRYAVGAVPGALLGGFVAVGLPPQVLQLAMVAVASLAALKVLAGWRVKVAPGALIGGGAATGFVSATSGGGGLIAGPMLLATGLSGRAYVGTAGVGAVAVHVARLSAYRAGGAVGTETLLTGALLAVAILVGNLLGDALREALPDKWMPRLEVGAVGVMLAASLVGLS